MQRATRVAASASFNLVVAVPLRRLVSSMAGFATVPPREAKTLLDASHTFLDVRTEEEFAASHVAGAVNVAVMTGDPHKGASEKRSDFLDVVKSKFQPDTPILVVRPPLYLLPLYRRSTCALSLPALSLYRRSTCSLSSAALPALSLSLPPLHLLSLSTAALPALSQSPSGCFPFAY
ncbi:unnamed protein product [Closterium sp. NIES-53]